MLDSTDFAILSMETVSRLSDHPREIAKQEIAKRQAAKVQTGPICNQQTEKQSPKLQVDEILREAVRLTDEELGNEG